MENQPDSDESSLLSSPLIGDKPVVLVKSKWAEYVAGFIFSFFVSLAVALAVLVFITSIYQNIPPSSDGELYLALVVIFTIALFLLRIFIKSFGKMFITGIMVVLGIFLIFSCIGLFASNRLCSRLGGTSQAIRSQNFSRTQVVGYTCFVPQGDYDKDVVIQNTSIFYSFLTLQAK